MIPMAPTAGAAVPEPVNILLVDDQPAKLLSYEVILADLGERLLTATSPRQAFEQLLRSDIAVVLMDVQMPELDGFELASMIREHPRFEKTAIIFVSAIHLTELDRLKGYAAGAVDYLSVPVVPEVLRAKVRIFVDLYRKTRQLERLNEELERRVQERTALLEASTRRLRESEQRRTLALAAGRMGSWDWNTVTGVMTWDAGQFRIFGVDEASWTPTAESVGALVHEEDRDALAAAIDGVLAGEGDFHAEFRILRPDGEVRWCITSGTITQDEQDQAVHLTGVTYDVTEQKLNQVALERLNALLEQRIEERTREREAALAQLFEAQKTEAIGQLTGGVAHDFNNLLMAILGSLELLMKRTEDPRSQRLVQNAFEGAQRGAALTKRLLAFARRQELKPQPVSLPDLIEGMQDLLRRAVGPSIAIELSLPAQIPPVFADANQLELALLNLAMNARDAMPEGGTLRIAAEETAEPGEGGRLPPGPYLHLSVADTGSGMEAATLAKATEPFFTTKGPGKGTGLGLSMVHGMVAQSGGALRLRSTPGEGTIVDLILPVARAPVRRDVAEPTRVVVHETSRKLKVLLVDDDDLVRAGTMEMIADLGHVVLDAPSADAALEILGQHDDIGLLLTDHAMPGRSGMDLIRLVEQQRPEIPAILASGYAELPAAAEPGAVQRLAKPFTQADLLAALNRALRARETQETAPPMDVDLVPPPRRSPARGRSG